jgi:hypothetical protein
MLGPKARQERAKPTVTATAIKAPGTVPVVLDVQLELLGVGRLQ